MDDVPYAEFDLAEVFARFELTERKECMSLLPFEKCVSHLRVKNYLVIEAKLKQHFS